jgi:hypothetical protein
MVCLTGDVHHMSMKGIGQRYLPVGKTESQLATDYLLIAREYGLKVTLFLTGKVVEEEWDEVERWLDWQDVELGGHTYQALTPNLVHWRLFKLVFGSPWGPAAVQERDVTRTVAIIEKRIGKVVSWRNHAYAHDKHTPGILSRHGVKVWSDEKSADKFLPYKVDGHDLLSLPINVMPDHEHIIHAHRTREINRGGDCFGNKSFPAAVWLEIVKNQITHIVRNNGIATILAHPICMYQIDGFALFRDLCKFMSAFRSITANEVRYIEGNFLDK